MSVFQRELRQLARTCCQLTDGQLAVSWYDDDLLRSVIPYLILFTLIFSIFIKHPAKLSYLSIFRAHGQEIFQNCRHLVNIQFAQTTHVVTLTLASPQV